MFLLRSNNTHSRIMLFTGLIWLVLWLIFINPLTAPPYLLLVPFVLIIYLLHRVINFILPVSNRKNKLDRRSVFSWFISVMVTLVIIISSLGQMSLRDMITLAVIFLIGCLYIAKLLPSKSL